MSSMCRDKHNYVELLPFKTIQIVFVFLLESETSK